MTPELRLFDSDELNSIGLEIIDLDNEYQKLINQAEKTIYDAFKTRWTYGKIIHENMDLIKEQCGSQKKFAETIRKSEAVISNNKRAYAALLSRGCNTWDEVVTLLKENDIKLTTRNFEKIESMLNAPKEGTTQIEQISKDKREVENIYKQIEDIRLRLEPGSDPEIHEELFKLEEDLEYINKVVAMFEPEKMQWESEVYLDFVRSFGRDLITYEPCERCDPHHTTPSGGSGSQGAKLPDFFCIPVSRVTHIAIESGLLTPTPEQILQAQFICLTSFLYLNMKRAKK